MATKAVVTEISSPLLAHWEHINQKLVALAEAMPEPNFNHRPAPEVRTFAAVLRHVAFWNRYVADVARGSEGDGAANELPSVEYAGKAKIFAALQAGAADAAGALRSQNAWNSQTIELVVGFIEHNCEHYGQLVVYARLAGIVPPASSG